MVGVIGIIGVMGVMGGRAKSKEQRAKVKGGNLGRLGNNEITI